MMGKIEGKRRKGQQKIRWLESITGSMDMNLSKLQKTVKDRSLHTTTTATTVKHNKRKKHTEWITGKCLKSDIWK